MTKRLTQVLEAVRVLSPDEQDDVARIILQLIGKEKDASPVPLSPEERIAIDRSKAAAARGEFATDDEVRAVWTKPRR